MPNNTPKINLLNLEPVQKFINKLGKDIKKFFGKEKSCIVALGDDGIFYALGLYQWLTLEEQRITYANMDENGKGLEEDKIKERKVLIVDNDIVSGKSYKRAMETMREKKERLGIKDIKFAVLCDRTGLADFSVEDYSAFAPWNLNQLDGLDLQIIKFLSREGRLSFVEIAKKTGLSPVGIKNRVEKLIKQGVLKIQGGICMEKFYSVSAYIGLEADKNTISKLIEKFKKSPLVYHLVKTSGSYNLIINIIASNIISIESFIAKEIRSKSGVKHIEVNIGELPIIPKVWNPLIS